MIITDDYLNSIKPKNARISDKYSARIYKYLKKHKNKNISVFKYSFCNKEEDNMHVRFCRLVEGEYIVTSLQDLYNSSIPFNSLDYMDIDINEYAKKNKDISDYWFKKYAEIGRCLYINHDLSWIAGIDNRFPDDKKDINERTCAWCGKKQYKKTRITIERYWD